MFTDPTTPEARRAARVLCERLIEQGVVIVDPDRTWLGPDVTIEPGARIWPDTYLMGTTTIAAGAEIRPGCWIEDSHIAPNALIKPHCVLEGAIVGADAQVGPMAHLRPGSTLGAGAKVGNFVETKKATLGAGAKASHLTYLGDAEVGPGANIGAGTITCNYDGHGKHRTTIGAGAFIGSNTALVAPIEVGEGAIVGAGSTLTRSVPDDALAVERAEERVLKGYAPKLHARNKRKAGT